MRIEWPTVAMIGACYGVFVVAGLFIWPYAPVAALLVMAVCAALHSSLQHEVLHGHPTRKGWVNELLIAAMPLAPAYPYRRFKTLHLRHHHDERLTDPYDDPESYYLDGRAWRELSLPMRALLSANNTLVGRIVLGPALMVAGFLASEARLVAKGDRTVLTAWALHLAGFWIIAIVLTNGFGIPVWLYVLVSGYLGMSIIAVRTFCEHQAAGDPDHRTIIVERSPLSWMFLNNNLHLVHHKLPALAWYKTACGYANAACRMGGHEQWLCVQRLLGCVQTLWPDPQGTGGASSLSRARPSA
ncbi:MAG: fatty acid desaturase [Phyllobacteriaceae bacterium]|nr:fatty acid desaturase [Phyllobacteriaceae bacterium]